MIAVFVRVDKVAMKLIVTKIVMESVLVVPLLMIVISVLKVQQVKQKTGLQIVLVNVLG